ncbi:MAG TPA: hypothetical protein VG711_09260 [Phycisphaerales bacterium]|nr:hypothetical protein [Phycisphaerales bacterium]
MKTVALVGHCGPDATLLRLAVQRAVPGITIAMANDDEAVRQHVKDGNALLVNRKLDGDFSANDGIELIQSALKGRKDLVVMLISNYEDAQKEAESAGARKGFGKSRVYAPETAELLKTALTG